MKVALNCTKNSDDKFKQANACHRCFNEVMIFIASYTTNYNLQSYERNQKCKLIPNRQESNKYIIRFSLNSTVMNLLTSKLLMRSMRCLNLCLDQGYGRGGTPIFSGVFEPLARVALYPTGEDGLGTWFAAA